MKGMMNRSAEGLGHRLHILKQMAFLSAALILTLALPLSRAAAEEWLPEVGEDAEAQQVDDEVEEIECFLAGDDAWTEAQEAFNGLEIVYGTEDGEEFAVMAAEDDGAEAESVEEADAELPADELWEQTEVEVGQPEPYTVEKAARVDGADCSVIVRYASDAGIPEDAVLTAYSLDGGSGYADRARQATGEDCDIFLMSLSLVFDGVDYANTCGYEVEVIMDEPTRTFSDMVGAMQFDGDRAAMLDATAKIGAGIERISFRTANA